MFSSDFMRVLDERGYIHQCTDNAGLDALAAQGRVSAYIGFDCTADSLHVGSLVQIMMLRWLQTTGHKPIVLLGGGTTKIGDPSGRDESRTLLTEDAIATNKRGIRRSFGRFLTFGDGPSDALLVDNADWLDTLGYIPFLRDVGAHFSINRMLTFDSVRLRLDREQPLSFLEFNYMILQAYDFLELSQARRLPPADGRLRPVGQHRERRGAHAAHRRAPGLRADHAAHHALLRREDGQDRAGRRLAQRREALGLRLLAVLAQHRTTPMSAASCGSSPSSPSTRSRATRRSEAPS